MDKTVSYDTEEDILYVNMGSQVKESIPKGGFIVDISYEGKIIGVEVLNASEVIGNILGEDVEAVLRNIDDADVLMKDIQGVVYMVLRFHAAINGQETEKTVSLEIPKPQATA